MCITKAYPPDNQPKVQIVKPNKDGSMPPEAQALDEDFAKSLKQSMNILGKFKSTLKKGKNEIE